MMDIAVDVITEALGSTLLEACRDLPGGPCVMLRIEASDDVMDARDAPVLVRVDGPDAVSLTYPLEAKEDQTMAVAFTVTLRRKDVPSLVNATTQQMRRATLACERAIARALVLAFDRDASGLRSQDAVHVYTPTVIDLGAPDTETEESVSSGTVTAVFPIEDRYIQTRSA